MTRALALLAVREWRDFFPAPWLNCLTELLSLLTTLTVYWFTARAFSALGQGDYFSYVVAGDALLLLPVALFDAVPRALRASSADGTLELFLIEPGPAQRPLLLAALATVPRECARALVIFVIGFTLFALQFHVSRVPLALLSVLPGIPAFLGLGLLGAAVLAVLGRGSAALGQVGMFSCLVAGAYFPLRVLPPRLVTATALSPFTLQLQIARGLLSGETVSLAQVGLLFIEGGALFFLGYTALGAALRRARRTGKPLAFPV